jgi:hypothetical protein
MECTEQINRIELTRRILLGLFLAFTKVLANTPEKKDRK